MKIIKYFQYLFVLASLLINFGCQNDMDFPATSGRIHKIEANLDLSTRTILEQKEDSYDMVTKWQGHEYLHVYFMKKGIASNKSVPEVKIQSLSENGRVGVFSYDVPPDWGIQDSYEVSCFTSTCHPLIDKSLGLCINASLQRASLSDFQVPVYFQGVVDSEGTISADFHHYYTYELLHIKNTSGSDIDFSMSGFEVDQTWYRSKGKIRMDNRSFVSENDGSREVASDVITIPSGQSDIIVSAYIPNGNKINNASLIANIDGKPVKSSNKKSSDVTLQTGHAYHMYAEWNGKELKFVNQNTLGNPLTFTSIGSTTVALTGKNVSSRDLEYNLNNLGWKNYSSTENSGVIQLSDNDVLSFRAGPKGNTTFEDSQFITGGTGQLALSGNIMTLLDASGEKNTIETSRCFYSLFEDCENITSAPELPALNLAPECYSWMFYGCSMLTEAPELPALNLAESCYEGMFSYCTSLKEAPKLPSTNLADECYSFMFNNCESLTKVPELPATTLKFSCYEEMFSGCSSLTEAPELPATTLAVDCYYGMFCLCTSMTKAPKLPATTLADGCYECMFQRCWSLTEAPELPATTLAHSCYEFMFSWCESLKIAPKLPAMTLADWCYVGMFYGCESLTQAPELPATSLTQYCYYEMFINCTSLTKAPELPALVLLPYCYDAMFLGCVNLNYVKANFQLIGGTSSLDRWLEDVSPNGTFVRNPIVLWQTELANIPAGWNIVKAQ